MEEMKDPLLENPRVKRRKRDESWLRTLIFLSMAVALLVHVAGYFTLKEVDSWQRKILGYDSNGKAIYEGEIKEFVPLRTELLSQKQFERILVQTKKVASTQRPSNEISRFQGEQTQRVENETVSPNTGDPDATGKKDHVGSLDTPLKEKASRKSPTLGHALLNSKSGKPSAFEIHEEGTGRLSPADAQDPNTRAKGSRDRLPKDIAIGVDTLLNTDEYVYASFFNRLKSEVGPRWEPMIQHVLDEPRNRIVEGEYVTETRFVCDRAGNIESVEILRRSGVKLFDEAAEQALLQTRRVSNPPQAFLELDGRYRFKLGFSVQVSRGGLQMNYIPDPRF